jgi:hypothetical protein
VTTILDRPSVRVEPTAAQAEPTPVEPKRRWPRYVAVGLMTGAVGLAAGVGLGYTLRNAEVASLTTATSTTTRNALAPLAQNWPHDVAVRTEVMLTTALAPLAQNVPREVAARTATQATASYDYSIVREHLAQSPTGW